MGLQTLLFILSFSIHFYGRYVAVVPIERAALSCVVSNDSVQLKKLVEAGLDPNLHPDANRPDMSLLHYAVAVGTADEVQILIEAGAQLNARTNLNVTPLLNAIHLKKNSIAKVLIEAGADVNLGNRVGTTPLMFAVMNNDPSMAEALLNRGADVNAKTSSNRTTALSLAVGRDYVSLVELLLKNGANRDLVDASNKKPIDYAKSEAVRELLRKPNNSEIRRD